MKITQTGNSKLGKVYNTSLPPIKTCVNCEACKKKCYAMKSYRMYPSVRKSWDNNLNTLTNRPAEYKQAIQEAVSRAIKNKVKYFRIHVAGDFISKDHVKLWIGVAASNPEIKFLAFTKAFKYLPKLNTLPGNLKVICSMWPGMKSTEKAKSFPIAFTYESQKDFPRNKRFKLAFECRGHCETCGFCFDKGYDVKFAIH